MEEFGVEEINSIAQVFLETTKRLTGKEVIVYSDLSNAQDTFGREIADVLLAVNRAYNKSDYIPTIAWGRNSRFCQTLEVGDNIRVWGRLQSREYQKKISENEVIKKVAYEVSISKMEKVTESEETENTTGTSEQGAI